MGLKNLVIKGSFWTFIEKFYTTIINLLFFIWLARELSVGEIGVLAYAGFFVFLSTALVDMGFAAALIQKAKLESEHIDSVFILNVFIGLLIFTFIQIWGHDLGQVFNEPILGDVLKPLSAKFLLGSFAAVPIAIMRRKLQYKNITLINIFSITLATSVGVLVVSYGGGVWGLIAQQIVFGSIQALLVVVVSKSNLKAYYSHRAVSELLRFSVHSFSIRMIGSAGQQGTSFIIGYLMGSVSLGIFSVANRIHQTLYMLLHEVISQVLFPIFSSIQNERERINNAFQSINKGTGLLLFPVYAFLFLEAHDLVVVLVGEKWTESGAVLSVMALSGISATMVYTTSTLMVSIGRPDIVNYLNLLGTAGKLLAYAVYSEEGLIEASEAWIVVVALMFPMRMYYFKSTYNYDIGKYLSPFVKPLILTIVTCVINVFILSFLNNLEPLQNLLFSAIIFLASYLLLVSLFSYQDIKNGIKIVLAR